MANVLYISHTGMTESLGESQVVQYVVELAKHNKISILSFEKPVDLKKYTKIKKKLDDAKIDWHFYIYSNYFGLFSTIKQICSAFYFARNKIKKDNIQIIHARSLIPALIAVFLKATCHVKLLFDIRGFTIDEKIFSGRIKKKSLLTLFLLKIEKKVYHYSDHIVTLTHISVPVITERFRVASKNITVIPTCANEKLFYSISTNQKNKLKEMLGFSVDDFLILRNGSINSYYDFESEIKLLNQLAIKDKKIKFLFLNQNEKEFIHSYLDNYSIVKQRSKILSVEFNKVSNYINACDLCIFFLKPTPVKMASAPTKFAELVACHVYSITNGECGDMDYYLKNYNVGMLMDLNEVQIKPCTSAEKVMQFIRSKQDYNPCDFDQLYARHFSVKLATVKYQGVYNDLVGWK